MILCLGDKFFKMTLLVLFTRPNHVTLILALSFLSHTNWSTWDPVIILPTSWAQQLRRKISKWQFNIQSQTLQLLHTRRQILHTIARIVPSYFLLFTCVFTVAILYTYNVTINSLSILFRFEQE